MVKISPSPCKTCPNKNKCSRTGETCSKFSDWMYAVWPAVCNGVISRANKSGSNVSKKKAGRKPERYGVSGAKKKVTSTDAHGNEKTYASIADAARKIGLNVSSVQHAVCGLSKTAGGYKWRYADAK